MSHVSRVTNVSEIMKRSTIVQFIIKDMQIKLVDSFCTFIKLILPKSMYKELY